MDIHQLIVPSLVNLFSSFVYLSPLFLLLWFFKSSKFKGIWGEYLVSRRVRSRLDKKRYHLLSDVMLPTSNGTTQIDHIIVSVYGVFVIETKNMKGWIFGGEKQKKWTQKIYSKTSTFQNPLHQNYKHVKTVQSLLGLANEHTFSLVVFVGESTFKNKFPRNVTGVNSFIHYIESKKKPILTEGNVADILHKLKSGRLKINSTTNKKHIKHVKHRVKAKESVNSCSCPACGRSMVLRTAKKGVNTGKQFWGCSDFPKCRGVIKVFEHADQSL